MKKIKTILAVLVLILTVQTAMAQKNKKDNPYMNKLLPYVTEQAKLTDSEAEGVKEILYTVVDTKAELKKETSLSDEEMKAKKQEMMAKRNKSFNKLLGKEKGTAVKKAILEYQKSIKKK